MAIPRFNDLLFNNQDKATYLIKPTTNRFAYAAGATLPVTYTDTQVSEYYTNTDRAVISTNLFAFNFDLEEFRNKSSKIIYNTSRTKTSSNNIGERTDNIIDAVTFLRPLLLEPIIDSVALRYDNALACKIPNKTSGFFREGSQDYIVRNVKFRIVKYIDARGHLDDLHFGSIDINSICSVGTFQNTHAYNIFDASQEPNDYTNADIVKYYDEVIVFDYIVFRRCNSDNNISKQNDLFPLAAYGLTVYSDDTCLTTIKRYDDFIYNNDFALADNVYHNNRVTREVVGTEIWYQNVPQQPHGNVTITRSNIRYIFASPYSLPFGSFTPDGDDEEYNIVTHTFENSEGHPYFPVDGFDPDTIEYSTSIGRFSNIPQFYEFRTAMGIVCRVDDIVSTTSESFELHIEFDQRDIIPAGDNAKYQTTQPDYEIMSVFGVGQVQIENLNTLNFFENVSEFNFSIKSDGTLTLATLLYVRYLNSTKSFGYDDITVPSDKRVELPQDMTADDANSLFDLAETNPSITYIDNSSFITPMEYYGRISNSVDFEDKVSGLVTEIEEEPVYFWVETLKNWCTFTINESLSQEALLVVDLRIWNGYGYWIPLVYVLDSYKKNFIPTNLKQQYIDALNSTDVDVHKNAETQLKNFAAMLVNRQMTMPFTFENLHTVDIDRSYHSNTANYAGHKKRYWYEYTPVYHFVRSSYKFVMAGWNLSFGMIYNGIYGDGVWAGIKTGINDVLQGTVEYFGRNLLCLVDLYNDLLMTKTSSDEVALDDPYQHLQCSCRYVALPYDEHYSSNDKDTFQTIKAGMVRYDNLEGGIINRETIIDYSVIPTTVGSPFVVRNSTGELYITARCFYSGPVQERASSETDLVKFSGIIEKDVALSNKMLQNQFGKGETKTVEDMFNTYGALPLETIKSTATSTVPETILSTNADILVNTSQTCKASIKLSANRSKTSSDVETASIHTITKW